jgi:hypothetical protein
VIHRLRTPRPPPHPCTSFRIFVFVGLASHTPPSARTLIPSRSPGSTVPRRCLLCSESPTAQGSTSPSSTCRAFPESMVHDVIVVVSIAPTFEPPTTQGSTSSSFACHAWTFILPLCTYLSSLGRLLNPNPLWCSSVLRSQSSSVVSGAPTTQGEFLGP